MLARAKAENLSIAAYLRTVALHAEIKPPVVPAVDARFLPELTALGSQLNDHVHAIHAGCPAPGLLGVLNDLLHLLCEMRQRLIGLQLPHEDTPS